MNEPRIYMIYFFQEILFLNLCISHGIVRSEILSQPLFYYKVSTVRPPWAACDDLYLWQWLCLLSLYIVCILYPQFYISHSGQIPCYHVLSLQGNYNVDLLCDFVVSFQLLMQFSFFFETIWFGLLSVCPEGPRDFWIFAFYLCSTPGTEGDCIVKNWSRQIRCL